MKVSKWTLISRRVALFAIGLLFVFGSSNAQTDSLSTSPADTSMASGPVATSDNIKRATFTTHVLDREPVDEVDSLGTTSDKIYFFTEIVDFEGGSMVHRWIYEGETAAEVNFDIGGPRWRVYSTKALMSSQTGEWIVEVTDGHGNVIRKETLVYY